jgi:poly(A) polymerase Pap1
LQKTPEVEEVLDVIDSRVPILKLKYRGFQIDLLYAAIDPNVLQLKKSIDKILKDEAIFSKLCQNS